MEKADNKRLSTEVIAFKGQLQLSIIIFPVNFLQRFRAIFLTSFFTVLFSFSAHGYENITDTQGTYPGTETAISQRSSSSGNAGLDNNNNTIANSGTTLSEEYSFLKREREHVFLAGSVIVVQGILIAYLIYQRRLRRKSQRQLKERLHFEGLLASLSARFVNLQSNKVYEEIKLVLESIGKVLDVDRISVFELSEKEQKLFCIHSCKNEGIAPAPVEICLKQIPWIREKILNGEVL